MSATDEQINSNNSTASASREVKERGERQGRAGEGERKIKISTRKEEILRRRKKVVREPENSRGERLKGKEDKGKDEKDSREEKRDEAHRTANNEEKGSKQIPGGTLVVKSKQCNTEYLMTMIILCNFFNRAAPSKNLQGLFFAFYFPDFLPDDASIKEKEKNFENKNNFKEMNSYIKIGRAGFEKLCERDLCLMWDVSVDEESAFFFYKHNFVESLVECLMYIWTHFTEVTCDTEEDFCVLNFLAFSSSSCADDTYNFYCNLYECDGKLDRLKNMDEEEIMLNSEVLRRFTEISIGIISNILSHRRIVDMLFHADFAKEKQKKKDTKAYDDYCKKYILKVLRGELDDITKKKNFQQTQRKRREEMMQEFFGRKAKGEADHLKRCDTECKSKNEEQREMWKKESCRNLENKNAKFDEKEEDRDPFELYWEKENKADKQQEQKEKEENENYSWKKEKRTKKDEMEEEKHGTEMGKELQSEEKNNQKEKKEMKAGTAKTLRSSTIHDDEKQQNKNENEEEENDVQMKENEEKKEEKMEEDREEGKEENEEEDIKGKREGYYSSAALCEREGAEYAWGYPWSHICTTSLDTLANVEFNCCECCYCSRLGTFKFPSQSLRNQEEEQEKEKEEKLPEEKEGMKEKKEKKENEEKKNDTYAEKEEEMNVEEMAISEALRRIDDVIFGIIEMKTTDSNICTQIYRLKACIIYGAFEAYKRTYKIQKFHMKYVCEKILSSNTFTYDETAIKHISSISIYAALWCFERMYNVHTLTNTISVLDGNMGNYALVSAVMQCIRSLIHTYFSIYNTCMTYKEEYDVTLQSCPGRSSHYVYIIDGVDTPHNLCTYRSPPMLFSQQFKLGCFEEKFCHEILQKILHFLPPHTFVRTCTKILNDVILSLKNEKKEILLIEKCRYMKNKRKVIAIAGQGENEKQENKKSEKLRSEGTNIATYAEDYETPEEKDEEEEEIDVFDDYIQEEKKNIILDILCALDAYICLPVCLKIEEIFHLAALCVTLITIKYIGDSSKCCALRIFFDILSDKIRYINFNNNKYLTVDYLREEILRLIPQFSSDPSLFSSSGKNSHIYPYHSPFSHYIFKNMQNEEKRTNFIEVEKHALLYPDATERGGGEEANQKRKEKEGTEEKKGKEESTESDERIINEMILFLSSFYAEKQKDRSCLEDIILLVDEAHHSEDVLSILYFLQFVSPKVIHSLRSDILRVVTKYSEVNLDEAESQGQSEKEENAQDIYEYNYKTRNLLESHRQKEEQKEGKKKEEEEGIREEEEKERREKVKEVRSIDSKIVDDTNSYICSPSTVAVHLPGANRDPVCDVFSSGGDVSGGVSSSSRLSGLHSKLCGAFPRGIRETLSLNFLIEVLPP